MSTSTSRRRPSSGILVDPWPWLLCLLWLGAACVHGPGTLRFRNEAPHLRVRDRVAVAEPVEAAAFNRLYFFDGDVTYPISYALDLPGRRHAMNVNALGDVPDSSWFTNRIGLSPADIRRGPRGELPRPPYRITKALNDRGGFFVVDAKNTTYVLKFDRPGWPELASAAGVISQRLLWAVGYHVPSDHVVFVRADDLHVDSEATITVDGEKVALTPAMVAAILSEHDARSGRYRGLASEFLAGKPKGPYATRGIRRDDPNDRVPHEHRRDLRGQYVFFSWLAHTDLHAGNRLDMWIEDPSEPGKGHLEHHLIDFDQTLGALAVVARSEWDAYRHRVDYAFVIPSILSFGVWKRPWEGLPPSDVPGIGRFDSEHYDPEGYHPRDYFVPFLYRDELDGYWATKILMGLSPEHIRAAVDAAQFSDPRSTETMVRTLVARQRAIGRHWFEKVTPVDRFEVVDRGRGESLCAVDLWWQYGFAAPDEDTSYRVRAYDGQGRRLPFQPTVRPDREGSLCVGGLPRVDDKEGYLIVGLHGRRDDERLPAVFVHLARAPGSGRRRVIGIDRRH